MDIPDDLIDLQRTRIAAEQAYAEYVSAVQARRRAEYPDDVVARCTWDEQEQAESIRLREEFAAAVDAVRLHPALAAAREAGGHHKLLQGSLDAAKTPTPVAA